MEATQAVPAANMLVPFNFQTFQTNEAVWGLGNHDWIKRFRVTRKGVGEFLHPESRDPQKIIDNIIERNPHLKEMGMPLTVRGKTGQEYLADTYDIWGVYQIAVVSNLPRRKIFLQEFPKFLQALQNYTILPPDVGDIKPELVAFRHVLYTKRGDCKKAICAKYGWSSSKFHKLFNEAKAALGLRPFDLDTGAREAIDAIRTTPFGKERRRKIVAVAEGMGVHPGTIYDFVNNPGKYTKPRKERRDKGCHVSRPEFQQVMEYRKTNPCAQGREIKRAVGIPLSTSTINRYIKYIEAHRFN